MNSSAARNLPREGTERVVDAIIERLEAGCSLTDREAHFLMNAYKTQSQEERSLSQKRDQLDDVKTDELMQFLRVASNGN